MLALDARISARLHSKEEQQQTKADSRRGSVETCFGQACASSVQCQGAPTYAGRVPGGAETLIHARRLLEDTLRSDPSTGVWAVIDVDFVNAFPSLEWRAIDVAMEEQVPELAAWTTWCHATAADID